MVNRNLVLENAKICFRNFAGLEGKYNPAGKRNFCVLIDSAIAQDLIDEGWNIRFLKPKEEDDPLQPYLQVSISIFNFPSKIVLITSSGKTILDESNMNILDWAEIEKVDLVIRPYNWTVNEKSGTKAYCKSLYVTLSEDDFEAKYRDIPDSAKASIATED